MIGANCIYYICIDIMLVTIEMIFLISVQPGLNLTYDDATVVKLQIGRHQLMMFLPSRAIKTDDGI